MKRSSSLPNTLLGLGALLLSTSCSNPDAEQLPATTSAPAISYERNPAFNEYWYSGVAEVNSYRLDINRYGQKREGDAVLIFVTEDFSKSKQVKLDNPEQADNDKVSVLKLNEVWKFKTGIYDYSMMLSVFTPVSLNKYPQTMKTTMTSQDWCGHSFSQINLEGDDYRFQGRSYFESEGDQNRTLKNTVLEDELWTRLRIQPESIPMGELDLLPSNFFLRLQHIDAEPKKARISLKMQESASQLLIEYLHLDRTLTIFYQTEFPHKVLGWEESDGQGVRVKGTLKSSLRLPYWQLNDNRHLPYRDSLNLTY